LGAQLNQVITQNHLYGLDILQKECMEAPHHSGVAVDQQGSKLQAFQQVI
jgi:hypothetical protein